MFTHLTLNKCLFEDLLSAEHPIFYFSDITAFSYSQVPWSLVLLFCLRLPRPTTMHSLQKSAPGPLHPIFPSILAPSYNTRENRSHTVMTFLKITFNEQLTMSRAPFAMERCISQSPFLSFRVDDLNRGMYSYSGGHTKSDNSAAWAHTNQNIQWFQYWSRPLKTLSKLARSPPLAGLWEVMGGEWLGCCRKCRGHQGFGASGIYQSEWRYSNV